jgi:hypothetical protein
LNPETMLSELLAQYVQGRDIERVSLLALDAVRKIG